MKNTLLLFGYVFAASFGAFVVGLNLGGISGALEFITAEFGLSAMAMALSTGISWACAFLVVQFFPIMLESFGAAIVFAGFGVLCLAAWLFIYIWIPETKGRSLEEIEKQLLKKE